MNMHACARDMHACTRDCGERERERERERTRETSMSCHSLEHSNTVHCNDASLHITH